MLIKKIRFYNYLAYYKEVEFDFSINDKKNVTIIYANNDVGKSCFFKGILFALYGIIDNNNLLDIILKRSIRFRADKKSSSGLTTNCSECDSS